MRAVLSRVSAAEALIAGETIASRLSECSIWQSSSVVALFSSLPGEVNTGPLIERARSEDKRLLFPRMLEGHRLEFAEVGKIESLRAGRYGVLEPDEQCCVHTLKKGMIVLVPGLAFDLRGGRLGRGAGYYDRALAECGHGRERPLFIGLALDRQLAESVPMAANDVRMDCVLTERASVRCA